MSGKDLHDLLPWYVGGSLGREEATAFEAHLGECQACARELRVWTELRKKLELHGEGYLADHPDPEALIAVVLPEHEPRPEEQQRLAVERHLAVCPTCAEEARWIRGDARAVEGSGADRVRAFGPIHVTRRAWIGPLAGVAAGFLLASVVLLRMRPSGVETTTGLIGIHQVQAATRDGGGPAEVRFAGDAGSLHLLLEVEVEAFPVRLTIERSDGRSIYSADGIGRSDLFRERFLFVVCLRRDYPDGDYVAKIVTARDGGRATEYPFRVEGEPGR
jgi:hypothetical protein